MKTYGYIATATTPNHDQASLVELRCERPDLIEFQPYTSLANKICQRLLECPPKCEPKFLDRNNLSPTQRQDLQAECRRLAVERGIPSDDISSYASNLFQKRLGELCLHEMHFEGKSVAAHLNELSGRFGPVRISRFFKVTVFD